MREYYAAGAGAGPGAGADGTESDSKNDPTSHPFGNGVEWSGERVKFNPLRFQHQHQLQPFPTPLSSSSSVLQNMKGRRDISFYSWNKNPVRVPTRIPYSQDGSSQFSRARARALVTFLAWHSIVAPGITTLPRAPGNDSQSD